MQDMNSPLDISRLLTLRKITRAIAEPVAAELRAHLATLAPLFHPRLVFGDAVRGATKQPSGRSELDAMQELINLYPTVARSSPFGLRRELEVPLDVTSSALEITPVEYLHEAVCASEKKSIVVSCPLKWVLSFDGHSPKKLRELVSAQSSSGGLELYHGILHHLMLHVILKRRPGLVKLLESMRFTVEEGRSADLGQLPLTTLGWPVATMRPADEVVVQTTEISGTASFEEVINPDDVGKLRDPLKDRVESVIGSLNLG
jgi:hypothetical protein